MCLIELEYLEEIILTGGGNTMENLPDEFTNKIKLIKLKNGNYVKNVDF